MVEGALLGVAQLLRWMLVAEHELLLFATFFFIVSAIYEAAVDISGRPFLAWSVPFAPSSACVIHA